MGYGHTSEVTEDAPQFEPNFKCKIVAPPSTPPRADVAEEDGELTPPPVVKQVAETRARVPSPVPFVSPAPFEEERSDLEPGCVGCAMEDSLAPYFVLAICGFSLGFISGSLAFMPNPHTAIAA